MCFRRSSAVFSTPHKTPGLFCAMDHPKHLLQANTFRASSHGHGGADPLVRSRRPRRLLVRAEMLCGSRAVSVAHALLRTTSALVPTLGGSSVARHVAYA